MRRRIGSDPTGLRGEMATFLRDMAAAYYPDDLRHPDPAGWLRRAAALDRGEPVTFTGWQLPPSATPVGRANDVFRLQPDGTLVELAEDDR